MPDTVELGERYRIVDDPAGRGLQFEERGEDALGEAKWDDVAGRRGGRISLPWGLVHAMWQIVRDARVKPKKWAASANRPVHILRHRSQP